MKLPIFPQDKANHFLYGTVAAVVGTYAAAFFGVEPRTGAVLAATIAGVGKELYDYVSKQGTPDPMDAVATAAGALPVILASN